MGRTSAKCVPKMEDEDEQNSIQTTAICEAEDARDCTGADAIGARDPSRRFVEEAYAAGARSLWSDYRRTQWRAERGVSLGGDDGNRMRDKFPTTRFLA